MPKVFEPISFRSLTLRNRIAVSPMCQYSSYDGFATDWHLVHVGSRAVGGAALVIAEAAAVSPEGRISPDDLGIWKDEHIEKLKQITTFIHEQGAVAGIQLAHAGRKASTSSPWKGHKQIGEPTGWQTIAPSPLPFYDTDVPPLEMTIEDIRNCVYHFQQAAVRAASAGFRLVEIHAAHGYLINQFLSPTSNKRTDEYGGSFENRTRFLQEIVEAVRAVWPKELPLFVRISASEWVEGGFNIDDSIRLATILKAMGVDLIDCSSGGNSAQQKIKVEPLYQVGFAEAIRKQAGIATGAVGLITTAEEAKTIIESGQADIVLLARQFLRDPYFPLHAAAKLGEEITWPDQYLRARRVR